MAMFRRHHPAHQGLHGLTAAEPRPAREAALRWARHHEPANFLVPHMPVLSVKSFYFHTYIDKRRGGQTAMVNLSRSLKESSPPSTGGANCDL